MPKITIVTAEKSVTIHIPFIAIVLNPRFFFVYEQYYQIMELSSKHIRVRYQSRIMLDEEEKSSFAKMNRDIYSLIELEKASEFDYSFWPSFGSILNWTSTQRSSPPSSTTTTTTTTKHWRTTKVQSDDAQSETSSFISNSSSSILSH